MAKQAKLSDFGVQISASAGGKGPLKGLNLKVLKANAKKAAEIAVRQTSEQILKETTRKAPKGFSAVGIKNSGSVDMVKPTESRFGYSAPHADVMDRGWRKAIIRPKKSSVLFIPLTRKAARQGPASSKDFAGRIKATKGGTKARRKRRKQNAKSVGVVGNVVFPSAARYRTKSVKRRGKSIRKRRRKPEFVFARYVRTRKMKLGSARGPNGYFSGTIKQLVKSGFVESALGTIVKQRLKL